VAAARWAADQPALARSLAKAGRQHAAAALVCVAKALAALRPCEQQQRTFLFFY
jgi:hypothetical protein